MQSENETGQRGPGQRGPAPPSWPAQAKPPPQEGPAAPLTSETLLAGRREITIRHGAEEYRLRVTASNKLILTK